ncbi:MAG: AAA family ATPase [Candidatus Brocadiia bacterium]
MTPEAPRPAEAPRARPASAAPPAPSRSAAPFDAAQGKRPEGVKARLSELDVLIRARYPLIYVLTWEEGRVLAQVTALSAQRDKKVFEWSVTTGLVPGGTSIQSQKHRDTATQDPLVALDRVVEQIDPAIYIFKDFHPFLARSNMAVIRRLREIAAFLKNSYKTILLVSPMLEIPPELEKDVTVVDFDLPRAPDFHELLDRIAVEVKGNPKIKLSLTPAGREKVVHSLLGLTLAEAENVLAKTLVMRGGLDERAVEVIFGEKKQVIRKSGLLEYYDSAEDLRTVGGVDALKEWLKKRSIAFSDEARAFGLAAPKGILLLGVQGCGKSLLAKAVSQFWRLPLLRFDVGRVFGSLVGSSEENVRRAIRVAESVAPAILWVDEIDKAFRGSRGSGGSTDGGTSARVFGTFLTWLSEKTAPVFVVATANDVTQLPPELLRKGRFDEIFFIDLPAAAERREIFSIHLQKRKRDPAKFDLDELADASLGFSGAEIEESIVSALFDVYYEKKDLTTEALVKSLRASVPLSKTMSEDIAELRRWADGRARPATTDAAGMETAQGKRKLEM